MTIVEMPGQSSGRDVSAAIAAVITAAISEYRRKMHNYTAVTAAIAAALIEYRKNND